MNLIRKLIPSMQKTEPWRVFAVAVAAVNDLVLEPVIARIRSLSNIYAMHEDDIAVYYRELGENFTIGSSEVIDRPLLIQQRLDEVHFKGYSYPIEKTLAREFDGDFAGWEPVYAPVDVDTYPYGTVFSTKEALSQFPISEDEWFLTSRCTVRILLKDLQSLYLNSSDENETSFADKFELDIARLIEPLIPLKIVFDGVSYAVQLSISYNIGLSSNSFSETDIDLPNIVRLDETLIDGTLDDIEEISIAIIDAAPALPINPMTNRFDALPMDAWSIDRPFPNT